MWQIQHWVLVEEVDRPNPCGGRLETRAPLCQASALLKRVVNRPIFGRTECIQRVLGRPGFRAGWSEGKCEETKQQDLPGHRKIPLPFQIAVRSFVGLNILRNDYLVSSSVDRKQQLRCEFAAEHHRCYRYLSASAIRLGEDRNALAPTPGSLNWRALRLLPVHQAQYALFHRFELK